MESTAQHESKQKPFPSQPVMTEKSLPQWRRFGLATLGLAVCFGMPLLELIRFAGGSQLYSYILLIPFISVYLVRSKRPHVPISEPARRPAGIFFFAGFATLAAYWIAFRPALKTATDEYLAVMMISFLLFEFGLGCLFLGKQMMRAILFPFGFLIFIVPIPEFLVLQIDSFLQYGSAIVASGFFKTAGTTFFQNGLVFQLPDITVQIAPECSGIHSTLVLFLTSLLAGYLFLRTPWKRAVFVLVVIPLGILRNGFRVFTIGELCVHIGPQMINSPIHRKGGPIFFALSLIPLFLLLLALQKSEQKKISTIKK